MPFNNEVNTGSRFVDTQQTFYQIGPVVPAAPKALTSILDCTQSLSFNLSLKPHIPVLGGFPATIELTILWFNADQSQTICQTTYEIVANQSTDGTDITTFIQGICRGAYAQVWCTGLNLAPSMGTITSLSGFWSTSSRPLSSEHIYQSQNSNPPIVDTLNSSTDGNLGFIGTTTLGAGASTGFVNFALTNKDIFIIVNAAGGTYRLRGGWGAAVSVAGNSNIPINLVTQAFPAINAPSAIFGPYKSITRPLFLFITNTASSSGQVNLGVFTQGAD